MLGGGGTILANRVGFRRINYTLLHDGFSTSIASMTALPFNRESNLGVIWPSQARRPPSGKDSPASCEA